MSGHRCLFATAALVLAATVSAARADVFNMGPGLTSLQFVTVGNAGNAADTRYDETRYGEVDYAYAIGKYEVTAGQYTAFLNAVAATDTYGLYNTDMKSTHGCQIVRNGSSGSYTYCVAAERANRPVNYVGWGDAARFINWLHNGQPTGAQGAGTTETGAYTLDGATSGESLIAIRRNADAKYWIPTENEWYKAAYHKNDGVTGNYFDCPTGSDGEPSNQLMSPDPGRNANFRVRDGRPEYAIGSPYWMTEVGAFENSESPYGTFDQGGNVWEWTETRITAEVMRGPTKSPYDAQMVTIWCRVLRGGSWSDSDVMAFGRRKGYPPHEHSRFGFRVASVPEPGN